MKSARYHHGNLPAALIDAAIHLIEARGVKSLTLRAVAEHVGVSHTAPYRHFADKAELLAAVAYEGYERLTHKLRLARHGATSARQALSRMATCYVDFAQEHADQFRLMVTATDERTVTSAQQLSTTIHACLLQLGRIGESDHATQIWSHWHGIASLMLAGIVSVPEAKRQAERAIVRATSMMPD